jgi:cell division septal protein FtsQ
MGRGPRHLFRRIQREHYVSRRFENPFFKKSPGGRRWLPWVIAVVAAAVPIGATAFVIGSPRFDIDGVAVSGTTTVSPDEVKAKAESYLDERFLAVFHRRNRFLFDPAALKKEILAAYAFDRIDVKKSGTSVSIDVQEKVPRLVWESGSQWFLADGSGMVIRETTKAEVDGMDPANPLPRFLDVNHAAVKVGDAVLTKQETANALKFEDLLRGENILFGTVRVDRLAGEWMSLETADGFDVLFDPTGDVALQASDLAAVLHDQVKDPSALKYVDVRFGDHVYFK